MDTIEVGYQAAEDPRKWRRARRWRGAAGAAVLSGAVVGGLALSHGQSSTTNASAASAVGAQTVSSTAGNQQGSQSTVRNSGGRFGGGMGLTVTGVSGNTITANGSFSNTVTITVNSATTYTEAGATVSLSAVQQGEQIAVRGTRNNQGALTATSVAIVLPTATGQVTLVNGSTVTITGRDGATHTVKLTGNTHVERAGQAATAAAITSGSVIIAEGTSNSDGSLTAARITIQLPEVLGQVTALSNGAYTVADLRGYQTITVSSSSATVYLNADGSSTTAAAIASGSGILAEGNLSTDGKTLTAVRITVLPAMSSGTHGTTGGSPWSTTVTPGTITPSSTQQAATGAPTV